MSQAHDESTMNPKNPRVAAIQMISTPRVDENLRTAAALIAQAAGEGADIAHSVQRRLRIGMAAPFYACGAVGGLGRE